jgi:antitoxin component HigA of HigAB toxin-antitoxin module
MSALFTALLEGESKESLAAMVCEMRENMSESKWQPIESVPEGVEVIRYEPTVYGRHGQVTNRARIVISTGDYPRKATHWMPLPSPPEATP